MKIITRLAITALILSLFVAAGCERKGHNVPKRGSYCTVQFRRDTLGAAGDLLVPPTSNMHNGAETCVTGKFSRMDEDWVILTEGKDETWIPRSAILLIKTYSEEPP